MTQPRPPLRRVEIGIFAHNESQNIAATLQTLDRQTILRDPEFRTGVHILANGCTDDTVVIAADTISALSNSSEFRVHDLPDGGKSRTWNRFVHDLSERDADLLVFVDADILIPEPDNISRLVRFLQKNPHCLAASSKAIKDIAHEPGNLSLTDKIIVAGAGGLTDWKKSIIGSLYVSEARTVRQFHLPIGLPVEDGFVRAMILTDVMRQPEDLSRIDSEEGVYHIYKSERSAAALIRHQVRLVIGSAINAVIFGRLRQSNRPQELLDEAAQDQAWLKQVISEDLPRRYGYVPPSFLTKRLVGFRSHSWRRKPVTIFGFFFDAVVYMIAQIKMARGVGVGFW